MSKSSKKRKGKTKGATRNRVAPARQRRQANSMGTLLGKAFAEMVKETSSQPKKEAIGLRVPDKQEVFEDGQGFVGASWTWYPFINETTYIKANLNLKYQMYSVSVEFVGTTKATRIKGNSAETMSLAECLISAADWEKSWPMILGTDMSGEPWKPYSRESHFKPKHAQDHVREESTL